VNYTIKAKEIFIHLPPVNTVTMSCNHHLNHFISLVVAAVYDAPLVMKGLSKNIHQKMGA
jgi:hypothetical protein